MSSGTTYRRPGFLLALGLCAVGGAVTLIGHFVMGPLAAPTRVPLANTAGAEACPSFSPDGRQLAYSARAGANDAFGIWVRALPKGAPHQLTTGSGSDSCPVWSSDGGKLAFLRLNEHRAQYVVVPSSRSSNTPTEQVVAETVWAEEDGTLSAAVSWAKDGKSLALVRTERNQPPAIFVVALDTAAMRRVTNPPAGSAGDSSPAVSPDGQTLAFVRGAQAEASDIWLCGVNGGEPRQLTFDARPIRGIAWTADGRDVVYASVRLRHSWKLWRIPAFGGSPREVLAGAKEANDPAIDPTGRRLAFTETPSTSAIWRASLSARDGEPPRAILRSAGREADATWSPDGRRIACLSDQTGADEVWVSDASGAARVQVTNLKGPALSRPRWSPDGRTLLFTTRGMQISVYKVAADAHMAQPQPLPLDPGARVRGLSWARDGQSVYTESQGAIWKQAQGGRPRQLIGQVGAMNPQESPDGRYVYYWFRRSIWRVPANGGTPEEIVNPGQFVSSLQPVAKGIYYLGWERPRQGAFWFYDFATQKSRQVLHVDDTQLARDAAFDVSPDGTKILYPKIDRSRTELVVIENFR